MAKATPTLEHRGRCDSGRLDRHTARNPAGVELAVTRCQDCGAERIVATGASQPDVGVPMLIGSGDEPVGPEDALGVGPKRGDYRDRLGTAEPHESGRSQKHRAEEIGDVAGKKGGVTTAAGAVS